MAKIMALLEGLNTDASLQLSNIWIKSDFVSCKFYQRIIPYPLVFRELFFYDILHLLDKLRIVKLRIGFGRSGSSQFFYSVDDPKPFNFVLNP